MVLTRVALWSSKKRSVMTGKDEMLPQIRSTLQGKERLVTVLSLTRYKVIK